MKKPNPPWIGKVVYWEDVAEFVVEVLDLDDYFDSIREITIGPTGIQVTVIAKDEDGKSYEHNGEIATHTLQFGMTGNWRLSGQEELLSG